MNENIPERFPFKLTGTVYDPYEQDESITHYSCDQKDFNEMYLYKEYPKTGIIQRLSHKKKKLTWSQMILSIFPMFQWLPKYKWHTDLFHDIVSGFTVGIMHIPQGLAYSILAGVPPVVGLYMAFFPVLIYAIMGTSRQISMGTFSVICIMSGKSVAELANNDKFKTVNGDSFTPIEVVTVLSIAVGLWQIALGVLRLGSLSVILSEQLISGLVTGAAILVINSQLKHFFGLSLPNRSGSLQVVHTVEDVYQRISSANYIAVFSTFLVTIILLMYQKFLKERLSKKIPFDIPVELIIIVSGTLLSKYFRLHSKFNLSTVNKLPIGFPTPSVPPLTLLPNVAINGLVIAIISFSVNISMASIFAEKHKYCVDANQELLATGSANIFGAFFSCAPFAASLSRTLIQDSAGGRTQLASIISCIFLSMVILFVGPFFEPLPHCVLTGILFAAMKGMLVHLKDPFYAWRQSKADGLIWISTFFTVVLVDIDIGLCVGVIVSLLHIIILGQKVDVRLLGHIPGTDVYVEKDRYQSAECVPGICILHIVGGLNFANKDNMRKNIFKQIMKYEDLKCNNIILDFSAVSYIDPSSIKCLLHAYEILKNRDISVHLTKCSDRVYKAFTRCRFFDTFPETELYPSIHEAVIRNRYS